MNYYLLVYKGNTSITSGEDLGSEYNLGIGCPVCGTGAKLMSNLYINEMPKPNIHFFRTMDGDFIVSEELYLKLNTIGLCNFNKVSLKQGILLSYYHLKSEQTLNKMMSKSKGIIKEGGCSLCQRDGFFGTKNEDSQFCYTHTDFDENINIYETWECFGLSNMVKEGNKVVRYARPRLIVSEEFKNIFEQMNIVNTSFNQVRIE